MLKNYRIVLVLVGGFILAMVYLLMMPVVKEEHGVIYYLRPGTSHSMLIAELNQQGIVTHPFLFSLYVYPQNTPLKTGEYLFHKGSSLRSIWHQVTSGTGLYYRAFAIIPGWSFAQIRQALAANEFLKHDVQLLDNKQVMHTLGADGLMPEGEFFPDSYYYTRGVSDLVILQRAYQLMQTHLNAAWGTRAPGLPYHTAYEALIAASLIEKEAYLNSERPVIAGVLINRLRKNMLLQIDPTVIYGMGDRYTGKIHRENLLEDNVYNTYKYKGLPPTPIAMPSLASLMAALHPDTHDYYYFVAKGDGSHQFSKTLPEHNTAVKALIRKTAS